MIRRDYILRMIEQFLRALAQIQTSKKARQWPSATDEINQELERLIGTNLEAVVVLSETELFARLMQGEPTQAVPEKAFILSALLQEAGELFEGQGDSEKARRCFLIALHLALDTAARNERMDCPTFAPSVEGLLGMLQDSGLPLKTQASLMHYYEQRGEFGKAEDVLFAMLHQESGHRPILQLGITFYERLLGRSDASLMDGNLPRAEVEASLNELRNWLTPRP